MKIVQRKDTISTGMYPVLTGSSVIWYNNTAALDLCTILFHWTLEIFRQRDIGFDFNFIIVRTEKFHHRILLPIYVITFSQT